MSDKKSSLLFPAIALAGQVMAEERAQPVVREERRYTKKEIEEKEQRRKKRKAQRKARRKNKK